MNWADRLAKLAQSLSTTGVVPDAKIDAAIARDSEVTSAVSTHAGASDPHADRSFATSAIGTHAGAADPHTGYQLESGLAAAITATKLDDFATPDDNTDLNVATTRHGLTPKLPNDATKFLDGTGAYAVPPGTGLTNPMTTPADLIVGGTSGAPARLAKGADGTVLTVDPTTHLLVWTAPTGGGAPTDATYLVTAANSGLSAEVVVPAAVLTVLDDTTVAAMVDTLGGASSTGTGGLVRATSPTLVTPALGTPASGVATNLTGTAASLTAGNVTTNANLTGDVTSSGNATTIGAAKVTEAMQVLADNTTQDASSTKHGYVPKSPADATKFLNGAATPAWAVPASVVNAWPSIPPKLSASLNLDWSLMQMVANPGAATRTVSGMLGGPGNAGTITSGDDADGAWQLLTTAATSNNEATMYTATMFRRDWGAIASGVFKTPAAFAVGVWEAGFSSAGLGTAAVPGTHCAIFRYSTAADGTAFWRTVTNNAGTGTVTATSVAVAVSTVYRWVIRLLPSSVEYYLSTGDGALALVDTCSATLPTATTPLTIVTRALTLENVAKTILWGRYTILTRP